jgi:hypothetical protein
MRMRFVAVIAAVVIVAGGCDWLQWGAGPTRSGTSSGSDLTTSNLAAMAPATVDAFTPTSPVATTHGMVFSERDGQLTAYDGRTNALLWTGALPAGTTAGGAPAIDGVANTIFVVVATPSNPVLVGFDVDGFRNCNTLVAQTCNAIFAANLGSTPAPATPPLVDGGRVFANGASSLYAFDAAGQTNCGGGINERLCSPLWSAATGFVASGIGPATLNGVVYDPINVSGFGVRAFNASDGSVSFTGTLSAAATATPSIAADGTVFAPAGGSIAAFAGNGCGSAICASEFTLVRKSGDPAGNFLGGVALDGTSAFATNGNGRLYKWSTACQASSCQPAARTTFNAPSGGSTTYSQTPAIENGVVLALARRVVLATDHIELVAAAESDLAELNAWDLGAGNFAAGITSVAIADGVVYGETNGALVAVKAPAPAPLAALVVAPITLKPTFSATTYDYTLACATGTNSVMISMTAVAGGSARLIAPITSGSAQTQTVPVNLNENQAAIVEATDAQGRIGNYWIRCLPHDFPPMIVTPHPANGTPTPGWYMTDDFGGAASWAVILDTNGTPVWYKRGTPGTNVDFFTTLGRNVVSFISAPSGGFGIDPNIGFDVYNLNNGQTRTIKSAPGTATDFHELQLLPNGDTIVLSYVPRCCFDLSGLAITPPAGTSETILDCEIQELDPQGQLVFKWDASDHTDPVAENNLPGRTTVNGQTMYDVYHCNSVDQKANGDLLVSARSMFSVFEVRRSDGKIVWKMGGKPVNKDGAQIIQIQNYSNTSIVAQHDARYMPNGDISLFDDQSFGFGPAAAGVEFAINFGTGTAQPVYQFGPPVTQQSLATGSFRRYRDGHGVAGWGIDANHDGTLFTEANGAGNSVIDANWGNADSSYRVIKVPVQAFDINTLRTTAGR